jgi:uncharacterized membrane protein
MAFSRNAAEYPPTIPKGDSMSETTHSGLSDTAIGAIAYITFIPAIVFLFLPPYNASSFVRFHSWQSIFISIFAFVVWFVAVVIATVTLFFGPSTAILFKLIGLCWVLIWILCVVNAINGKRFKLPVLGALAEKQAGA